MIMEYYDIVDFPFEEFRDYGFGRVYVLGRDIFEYFEPVKSPRRPAILTTENPEIARRHLKAFDVIYLKNYATNVALARGIVQRKKLLLVAAGDLLAQAGAARATILHKMARFVKFYSAYGAYFVLATMAKDIYGARSPYELELIGECFGLARERAQFALTTAGWL